MWTAVPVRCRGWSFEGEHHTQEIKRKRPCDAPYDELERAYMRPGGMQDVSWEALGKRRNMRNDDTR